MSNPCNFCDGKLMRFSPPNTYSTWMCIRFENGYLKLAHSDNFGASWLDGGTLQAKYCPECGEPLKSEREKLIDNVCAFVQVSTEAKDKLIEQLKKKRYVSDWIHNLIVYEPHGISTVPKEGEERWRQHHEEYQSYINCNAYANEDEELATWLFLELAQMRSDRDNDQWFKDNSNGNIYKMNPFSPYVEEITRLTPLELAEAVQQGRVQQPTQ